MMRVSVVYPTAAGKKFSLAAFQAAMKARGKKLFDDVPNFTDITPQVQISEIIG